MRHHSAQLSTGPATALASDDLTADAPTANRLEDIRQNLREQAFLFDDPKTYEAGVEDALQALADLADAAPAG